MNNHETFNPLTLKGNAVIATRAVCRVLKQRVNYKCNDCGKGNKRLEIHHIDRCGLNWNISNLVVLCTQCHGKRTEDHALGKRKELPLDWGEYPKPTLEDIKREYQDCFPRV